MSNRSLVLLAACCLLYVGCQQATAKPFPSDSFRLTVNNVVTDGDVRVSLLTIQTSVPASLSLGTEGSHSRVGLLDPQKGSVSEGQVILTGARIHHRRNENAHIQTLLRAQSQGGKAGGPSVHEVLSDVTLETFLSVSAKDGVYKLDTPITIAQLQGKPVTLVVGKPID